MHNFNILQGGQEDIQVFQDDDAAVSVKFIMKNVDTDYTIEITEPYTDGIAQITIEGLNTSVVGTYDYQLNENISGGGIRKHGILGCADGDCPFGQIFICEALDGVVS